MPYSLSFHDQSRGPGVRTSTVPAKSPIMPHRRSSGRIGRGQRTEMDRRNSPRIESRARNHAPISLINPLIRLDNRARGANRIIIDDPYSTFEGGPRSSQGRAQPFAVYRFILNGNDPSVRGICLETRVNLKVWIEYEFGENTNVILFRSIRSTILHRAPLHRRHRCTTIRVLHTPVGR